MIMTAKANTVVVKIAPSRSIEVSESPKVRGAPERKNIIIISVAALKVRSIRAREAPKRALTAINMRRLCSTLSPLEML